MKFLTQYLIKKSINQSKNECSLLLTTLYKSVKKYNRYYFILKTTAFFNLQLFTVNLIIHLLFEKIFYRIKV